MSEFWRGTSSHHVAPSGTARELAETLGQIRTPEPGVPLADLHGPVEARGTEVAGTRIHSVRLPSFVVTTEILFGGPDERLIMRHDPGKTPDPTRPARSAGKSGVPLRDRLIGQTAVPRLILLDTAGL